MKNQYTYHIMKNILSKTCRCLAWLCMMLLCAPTLHADVLPLIPYPSHVERHTGTLQVQTLKHITYTSDDTRQLAKGFADELKTTSGISLRVVKDAEKYAQNSIRLLTDAQQPKEGYTLDIDSHGVRIGASARAGHFYALQTLRQLLPPEIYGHAPASAAKWALPCVSITDTPAMEHRGFMLDVVRHFFTVEEVKRALDIMASYKLNRLHWHLTDDQGWRIFIPEYPRLTSVGSIRKASLTNRGSSPYFYDDTEYGRGMWYTPEQLREVADYAKQLNIEIIPEVDLPGHMVAAVTAYPEFSCDSTKRYEVRVAAGVSEDVLNIGDDKVVNFLKCVLGHVAEAIPGRYIHIGGDECPTDVWKNNPDCLRRVREKGLAGIEELQAWLVEELGTYLKEEYGRDIVVWDELLAHWRPEFKTRPLLMAWRGLKYTREAADKGFRCIAVPSYPLYLDLMQVHVQNADIEEGYQGGYGDEHVNTLEQVYAVNPVAELEGREDFCVGTQANLWTESCCNFRQAQYQMLPRLIGLSEVAWLPAAKKSWPDFLRRLQHHDEKLDAAGRVYAKHHFEPTRHTAAETACREARHIIAAAQPGTPGHPAAEVLEQLKTALSDVETADSPTTAATTALQAALRQYKSAPVALPEAGRAYRIRSAATYYKALYLGSTLYEKRGALRFHYTPQNEPEELWLFHRQADGTFVIENYMTGRRIRMGEKGANLYAECSDGTPLHICPATQPTKQYDYKPGVLCLGRDGLYLYGRSTGAVVAGDNPALCHPGTWYVEECTDFTQWLRSLCDKCELLRGKAMTGEAGTLTPDKARQLQEEVIQPARALLKKRTIDADTYRQFVQKYFLLTGEAK